MIKIFSIFFCAAILVAPVAFGQKQRISIEKKITDATPKALPQSPLESGRPSTDAKDKGLKGRVKSVLLFCGEALYTEEHYNDAGYLVKSVAYDKGRPYEVSVYGYIDGMRVRRIADIPVDEWDRPDPFGDAERERERRDPKRDHRYDARYVRKYDDAGRLTEILIYRNNGESWGKNTYIYQGDSRIEQNYYEDGRVFNRITEKLDANGNVIERVMVVGSQPPHARFFFKYEFDALGNWIIQNIYSETTVAGKKALHLECAYKRKIAYFP